MYTQQCLQPAHLINPAIVHRNVITKALFLKSFSTVKPVLSGHAWAKTLNRGGVLIEVKMHGKATIGTRPSGP